MAIIFDPEKRKILIIKQKNKNKNIKWQFPEGKLRKGEDIDSLLKKEIKEKTGLKIENLGAVFSRVWPEKEDMLAIYYLCEAVSKEKKSTKDFIKLKWIPPKEIEKHFTTSFHPNLKEYLFNLG